MTFYSVQTWEAFFLVCCPSQTDTWYRVCCHISINKNYILFGNSNYNRFPCVHNATNVSPNVYQAYAESITAYTQRQQSDQLWNSDQLKKKCFLNPKSKLDVRSMGKDIISCLFTVNLTKQLSIYTNNAFVNYPTLRINTSISKRNSKMYVVYLH